MSVQKGVTRVAELRPGFRRHQISDIKGTRTRHVTTFNPHTVNSGETIYVDLPRLKDDACLVPDSLALLFDVVNGNAKSWFWNNLGRLLQERLVVKYAGEIVYDNTGESLLSVYRDLWLSDDTRGQMVEDGIASEATRKKISKDDASNNDSTAALLFGIYGTKQRIRLNKILEDHGLYAPHGMMNNLQYLVTLPDTTKIMGVQSRQSAGGLTLKNIELEYETIENDGLAAEVLSGYEAGRSLSYEHATLMKTVEWAKGDTIHNETINLPRKSMRAIVLLFTNKTRAGSEEYVYPNIESVKVTVEGEPNSVYSQGIPKRRFFTEAKRLFEKRGEDPSLTISEFFDNKFSLVIDLRTVGDALHTADGRKLVQTQSGVLLEITKTATTANVMCHIFVLADGLLNIAGKDISGVHY